MTTDIGELLGYAADGSAAALGLNLLDHVAVTRGSTAVLWKGGTSRTNVPLLLGDAEVPNAFVTDADLVIGESCDGTGQRCRPFVSQNGLTHPLTQDAPALMPASGPSFTIQSNIDVNGKGEILINAVHNGQNVVALLVPNGCVNP